MILSLIGDLCFWIFEKNCYFNVNELIASIQIFSVTINLTFVNTNDYQNFKSTYDLIPGYKLFFSNNFKFKFFL